MKDLPILNLVVDRLKIELEWKRDSLLKCASEARRMNKLRQQIASIETRLRRAEKLQETALARPDASDR